LFLMSDVNSRRHQQWFYFQVSNIQENVPFTFNIVNCIKSNSQFNYGMQPVVFSVMEALDGKPGWVRSGTSICYYRNGYRNTSGKKARAKVYHSATFNLQFSKRGDICYVAYHYPYSYSRLLVIHNSHHIDIDTSCLYRYKSEAYKYVEMLAYYLFRLNFGNW
jgi:hypothetical protein